MADETTSRPQSVYGQNLEGMDFFSVTTYTFDKDIYRGHYNNRDMNEQLYIWAKKADLEYIEANLENWLKIEETVAADYHKFKVTITIEKKYPLAILYVGSSEEDYELYIDEIGNISELEAGYVETLNETLAEDKQIDLNFGYNNSKSLFDAMLLGMKFQRYVECLEQLDYTMISTVESGLITQIPWSTTEE